MPERDFIRVIVTALVRSRMILADKIELRGESVELRSPVN
jgi:hypothetical protein